MKLFADIYERAAKLKGGEEALKALLPTEILSADSLVEIPDDRFLSAMTQSIFQAGFNWDVIRKKWPGFEESFWGFDIERCASMSPDDFDALCKDKRIVKNPQKIESVPKNAEMILEAAQQHGSFAKMIANWPDTNFIGLLDYLKINGARLGSTTAQYFLRHIGRDGFLLNKDGVAALIDADVVSQNPSSKSDMRAVQNAFNIWMDETDYRLADISRILALSISV